MCTQFCTLFHYQQEGGVVGAEAVVAVVVELPVDLEALEEGVAQDGQTL